MIIISVCDFSPHMYKNRLAFSNTSLLHLHCFEKLYLNLHGFLSCFYGFWKQSDNISTLLNGRTLLKTPLIISVVLKNSRGERAKRFWIRNKKSQEINEMRQPSTNTEGFIHLCPDGIVGNGSSWSSSQPSALIHIRGALRHPGNAQTDTYAKSLWLMDDIYTRQRFTTRFFTLIAEGLVRW